MSEIEAMKAVDDALAGLSDDVRPRVLAWLNDKFGGVPRQKAPDSTARVDPSGAAGLAGSGARPKGARKVALPKLLKELSLTPTGKQSLKDFVDLKKPSSMLEKCVVASYYFFRICDLNPVTADHIYTAFKGLAWRVPSDLVNTLQQAGSKGWLDTANSADIKVTPMGENLVEHDLPKS